MSRGYWFCTIAGAALIGAVGCSELPMTVAPVSRITCFDIVPVSLKDAVEVAESEGGKAIDAGFRALSEMACMDGHSGHYDVTVLTGQKLTLVRVDADTRQVGPITPLQSTTTLRARISAAERARVKLRDAVENAEAGGGKAREAHAGMNGGKPGYAITLTDRGSARSTWIEGS